MLHGRDAYIFSNYTSLPTIYYMKVDAMSAALDGLMRAKEKLNTASSNIAREGGGSVEDIIDTKTAVRDAEANIAVIKVVDDLERSLLDTIA